MINYYTWILSVNDYSCHDQPLGNIETGFKLFDGPVKCTTGACVSKISVRYQNVKHAMPLFPVRHLVKTNTPLQYYQHENQLRITT